MRVRYIQVEHNLWWCWIACTVSSPIQDLAGRLFQHPVVHMRNLDLENVRIHVNPTSSWNPGVWLPRYPAAHTLRNDFCGSRPQYGPGHPSNPHLSHQAESDPAIVVDKFAWKAENVVEVGSIPQGYILVGVGNLKSRAISGMVVEVLVRALIAHGVTALEMPQYGIVVIRDGKGSRSGGQNGEDGEEKEKTGGRRERWHRRYL